MFSLNIWKAVFPRNVNIVTTFFLHSATVTSSDAWEIRIYSLQIADLLIEPKHNKLDKEIFSWGFIVFVLTHCATYNPIKILNENGQI